MNSISKIFSNTEVNGDVTAMMNTIKEELQAPFVPNFFKVWGDAPEAFKGISPAMKHILGSGHLSRPLKEMIMIAISSKNDCLYCTTAHQAFASMMGISMDDIQSLKSNYTTNEDPKTKAAIDYATKVANNPKSGTQEDISNLKALGYSKAEILELVAMSGMAVFYNHLADATQVNIDAAFLSN